MCRCRAQSSSWKLPSLRLLQIAFHSSYWVTESKPGGANRRRVVAVDYLTDDPRVCECLPDPGQHLRPEPVGDGVGGVEAPAVGTATQPVGHHVGGVRDDVGVVMVERDQLAVPFERVEIVAAPAKPRRRRIIGSARHGIAVAGELGADVVEDAVEKYPQPAPVRLGDQMVEVGVVAQPRVDAVVVGRVVTVCAGSEQRPERDARRAEFDGVIEPVDDPPQSVFVGGGGRFGGEGADEAQRVDLPPDRMLDPGRFGHGRNFAS